MFKYDLTEAIQQIRSEFRQIAEEHKAESERFYQIRLDKIQQQRDREALMMDESVRSLQTEKDRLHRLVDEAQIEVSKRINSLTFRFGEP